jgi:hypothetical protein
MAGMAPNLQAAPFSRSVIAANARLERKQQGDFAFLQLRNGREGGRFSAAEYKKALLLGHLVQQRQSGIIVDRRSLTRDSDTHAWVRERRRQELQGMKSQ